MHGIGITVAIVRGKAYEAQACTAEEGDELNANLHKYVCAGWQREILSCPIYHLHHWYLQREVITFYYFFFIS